MPPIAAVVAGSGYPDRGAWAEEYLRSANSDADALRAFGPRDGRGRLTRGLTKALTPFPRNRHLAPILIMTISRHPADDRSGQIDRVIVLSLSSLAG